MLQSAMYTNERNTPRKPLQDKFAIIDFSSAEIQNEFKQNPNRPSTDQVIPDKKSQVRSNSHSDSIQQRRLISLENKFREKKIA